MKTAAHEFPEPEEGKPRFCKWCGQMWFSDLTATCLQRAIPQSELAPEPKRREYACEDQATISSRLLELARERLPVEPEPHMDPGDCCV